MKKKQLPTLKADGEAEAFVAESNLTEFDLSKLVPLRFDLRAAARLGAAAFERGEFKEFRNAGELREELSKLAPAPDLSGQLPQAREKDA